MFRPGNQSHYKWFIKLISLETFITMSTFTVALLLFVFLAHGILDSDTFSFDQGAFQFTDRYISASHTQLMEFISFFGSHLFLIPANLILIIVFIVKKDKWNSIKIPAVAITSVLMMLILKLIFQRARPVNPLFIKAAGFSFPSGHALMSITFYGLLLYILISRQKNNWINLLYSIIFSGFILIIGLSRIYLRVHYASDVIAGFSLGLAWLIISLWILSKMEKRYLKTAGIPSSVKEMLQDNTDN